MEAQILDLLDELRARRGLSLLLVSHNLGIVDRLCDRVVVLYAGRVVEGGPTAACCDAPRHPYTRGLLAALPRLDRARVGRLAPIPGGLPDLTPAGSRLQFPAALRLCRRRAARRRRPCGRRRTRRALPPDDVVADRAGACRAGAGGPAPAVAQPTSALEAAGLSRAFAIAGRWRSAGARRG